MDFGDPSSPVGGGGSRWAQRSSEASDRQSPGQGCAPGGGRGQVSCELNCSPPNPDIEALDLEIYRYLERELLNR
jgi:hypothetical protein